MFCLLPMRFSATIGRFQTTCRVRRSTVHSSIWPVARSVATFRNTRSFQITGVEPLKAGSGSFHATFSVALHLVGKFVSALTPLSDGPRQFGQLPANSEVPARQTAAHTIRTFFFMTP